MASDVASIARKRGFNPVVLPLNSVSLGILGNLRRVLIVTSSYGDGEMPDSAQQFWEALDSDDPVRFENLTYSVMAMGDSGYERFCNAGRLIDERLASRGALRVADRADCDVNYATKGFAWVDAAVAAMQSVEGEDNITRDTLLQQSAGLARPKWTRHKPFLSEATENRSLATADADKDVRHIVFDISGSGIVYEPGDCIGLLPTNDPSLVAAFFDRFGTCAHAPAAGFDDNLGTLLSEKLEIRIPSHALILKVEELAGDPELTHVVEGGDRDALDAWLWGRDILDLLDMVPAGKLSLEALLPLLNPLQHRTYSIASSAKLHPDEIHLTVAKVQSHSRGRDRLGVCSGYLAERLATGAKAPIFMSPNRSFRLPSDDNASVIMIGPGTGVAPFRAFLQERKARGAKGRNWLFFGNRHRDRDFLYGKEFAAMQKDGLLTRLDLAFSRDQADKIYVQNLMQENAKELFSWLDSGAYLYVCGDGKRMAYDVEEALLGIVGEQGGLGLEEAQAYVDRLRREKRYLRDVY
ncbi:sulfite reductase flavoprotein subunit alpha (plasmid) [Paracoccus sp. TOH]|nr:sulfite reductase flavoprotein subunit alpha [Paracoccus sp. TOH]